MNEIKCISVEKMGEAIGISRSTAFCLARQENFYPAFRIGKRILVNVNALEKWIEEQSGKKVG